MCVYLSIRTGVGALIVSSINKSNPMSHFWASSTESAESTMYSIKMCMGCWHLNVVLTLSVKTFPVYCMYRNKHSKPQFWTPYESMSFVPKTVISSFTLLELCSHLPDWVCWGQTVIRRRWWSRCFHRVCPCHLWNAQSLWSFSPAGSLWSHTDPLKHKDRVYSGNVSEAVSVTLHDGEEAVTSVIICYIQF